MIPTPDDFAKLAAEYTLVPVHRRVAADLETPVSAFLRVARDEPEAFLLESVEGGEHVGRYTFIGVRPYQRMTARGGQVELEAAGHLRSFSGDLFAALQAELDRHTPAPAEAALPPFTGGAVGFLAYDAVRSIERLPVLAADELHAPDAHLMFFDEVLAFDHVRKEIHLIVTAGAREPLNASSAGTAYADAQRRLDALEHALEAPFTRPAKPAPGAAGIQVVPRTEPGQFLAAVDAVKEYIRAGDVFQCVLSQRFDCTPAVDAFEIYRSLRIVNPSPYLYFLRFRQTGDSGQPATTDEQPGTGAELSSPTPAALLCHIVGSSPEMLVRVSGRRVEYRPIAGTRPRGTEDAADRALEASLRADPKEVAEHIMLVDLGRNDVGRIAEFGSVHVTDLMFIERYSHVMHLVSAVAGTLRAGLRPLDALRSCFPAGTLSGAPKIRAMQIIEELEPARRGVYGGAIVYAGFSGNLDSCIAIRTLFMDGDRGHVQAGAGIVADSVPEAEHEECRNKAAAVFRAIDRARGVSPPS